MITIHYDFTDGTEVSFIEGRSLSDNFNTHCLDFFNMDEEASDVIVVRRDGKKIIRSQIQKHCSKEIRKSHDIHKMLLSNTFEWL